MIDEVFRFLRERLNKALSRDSSETAAEDLFVFAGSGSEDAVSFKSDAVSLTLVRVEEEVTLRQADPYAQVAADGVRLKVEPEIRLNLYLLLVARFPDNYVRALHHLSDVIRYFQKHRVFDSDNAPDLHPGVARILLELQTPTFSEQNQIWGTLRSAYLPSALYKVRMIVFDDEAGQPLPPVRNVDRVVQQLPSA